VVQVTSVREVAEGMKVNRIYNGYAITQPFGSTEQISGTEEEKRVLMVNEVLMILTN
jgi:hypothetical protein